MAEEKKIADEVMNEEELEQIAGGYANAYYFKDKYKNTTYYKVVLTDGTIGSLQEAKNMYDACQNSPGGKNYSIDITPEVLAQYKVKDYKAKHMNIINADDLR